MQSPIPTGLEFVDTKDAEQYVFGRELQIPINEIVFDTKAKWGQFRPLSQSIVTYYYQSLLTKGAGKSLSRRHSKGDIGEGTPPVTHVQQFAAAKAMQKKSSKEGATHRGEKPYFVPKDTAPITLKPFPATTATGSKTDKPYKPPRTKEPGPPKPKKQRNDPEDLFDEEDFNLPTIW